MRSYEFLSERKGLTALRFAKSRQRFRKTKRAFANAKASRTLVFLCFNVYILKIVASAPIRAISIIKSKQDITNPAIANPLGFLNIPTNENINPNAHKIQLKPGIHEKNIPHNARTNPAVPTPFDFFSI